MADGYATTDIASLARADGWSPLRKHLDVQSFGVNAWTVSEVGGQLVGEHDEVPSGHEELYLIVSGRATFTVAGEEIDAAAGTVVFVSDPAVKRKAVAAEPGTTVFAVGGKPGEAYAPRAWEVNAEVFGMFDEGRFTDAREMLLGALERYDDRSVLLFNLACAEARLGNEEAALDYLERGVAARPGLAGAARDDEDLASLRGNPRFDEVLGAATPG